MKRESPQESSGSKSPVLVAAEDAEMVRKIRRILKTGKNAEIRQDASGKPKVFKVSREIEQ